MEIDSVLHIILGGIVTIFLFAMKIPGIGVLFSLGMLAGGKELYDHFFVLGHCYPECIDEHLSDFFFSFLFFFLYIPILSVTLKDKPQTPYKQYAIILTCVVSAHLTYHHFTIQQRPLNLLALNTVCKVIKD